MVCDNAARAVEGIMAQCCSSCPSRNSTAGFIGVWDGPEYRVRIEPRADKCGGSTSVSNMAAALSTLSAGSLCLALVVATFVA